MSSNRRGKDASVKKITVRNIGKNKFDNRSRTCPVISISGRYSSGACIPGSKAGRNILYLEFFAGDHFEDKSLCITEEHAKQIREFILALPDDTTELLVNCGEGKIRSYTVCMVLYRMFDAIQMHDGSGVVDDYTYYQLRRWLGELEEQAEQVADSM